MARKGKKKFDVTGVLLAAGGGGAAGFVSDIAEDKLPSEAAAALPAVVGAGVVYFAPDYAPAGYGMIGASAAEFVPDLLDGGEDEDEQMEGFNRALFRKRGAIARGRARRRMRERGISPERLQRRRARRAARRADSFGGGKGRARVRRGQFADIVRNAKMRKPGTIPAFEMNESIEDLRAVGLKD